MFAYWDHSDISIHSAMLSIWREHFPSFRFIGDEDVSAILRRNFSPDFEELYRKIAIPSCRSDIARLAGIYEWGGLYVDCSCTLRDAAGVQSLLAELEAVDLLIFDMSQIVRSARPDPRLRPMNPERLEPLNSVIIGRKTSPVILLLLIRAFEKLQVHFSREAFGYVPYHIGWLTGPGHLRECLIDDYGDVSAVKPEFRTKLKLVPEDGAPIQRHIHNNYKSAITHWFERQKSERLFLRGTG